MKRDLLASLLVCAALAQTTFLNAQQAWTTHTLRAGIVGAWSRSADFDADGDPDILVQSGDTIFWYENLRPGWAEHLVDATFRNSEYALVQLADMDADGDMDVLKAPYTTTGTDSLTWDENRNKGADWVKHNIAPVVGIATELPNCVGDLDADGDMDIAVAEYDFVNNPAQSNLYWLENQGIAGQWTKHVLLPGNHWYCNLADMDGDGDLDVVFSDGSLFWLENQLPATTWPPHGIASGDLFSNHYYGLAADFTGDGLPDIASAPAPSNSGGVTLYALPNGDEATIHPQTDMVVGAVGDLDADGDLDIFYGGVGNSLRKMGWAENQNNGTAWVRHDFVAASTLQRIPTGLADIDGDGDQDLVSLTFNLATNLGSVFWAENPQISTGTAEAGLPSENLSVSPNPVGDWLWLDLPEGLSAFESQTTLTATVSDAAGRTVFSKEISGNTLNVSGLPPGVYFLSVSVSTAKTGDGGWAGFAKFSKN